MATFILQEKCPWRGWFNLSEHRTKKQARRKKAKVEKQSCLPTKKRIIKQQVLK